MVSDSDLIARLHEFLRQSDLNTTTTAIARRKLEEDFGVDLSDRKKFIREQVDLFLQSQVENAEEGDGEEGDGNQAEESGGSGATDDEEGDDDNEGASNGKRAGKKRTKKPNNEVKKRTGGFNKLCSLSPQLQDLLGAPTLARTEVVKQIWVHIREKNLQDPANKRNIICDEPLLALFGVKSIDMFQMNKALSKHIWPLGADEAPPVKSTEKERKPKQERDEDSEEPKRKEKRQKASGNGEKSKSGFLAPIQVSDALAKFIGTGESTFARADVIKIMWDYIKVNNLQDPSDKRIVICDEKLKELFAVDSFTGFTVTKLLSSHFIKS